MDEDSATLVGNGEGEAVARVGGSGLRRQSISDGAQFSVSSNPTEQHGILAEGIRSIGAMYLTRNEHIRPLIPTARLCAVVNVEDEWASVRGITSYDSSSPYRRPPTPTRRLSRVLAPVSYIRRAMRGVAVLCATVPDVFPSPR